MMQRSSASRLSPHRAPSPRYLTAPIASSHDTFTDVHHARCAAFTTALHSALKRSHWSMLCRNLIRLAGEQCHGCHRPPALSLASVRVQSRYLIQVMPQAAKRGRSMSAAARPLVDMEAFEQLNKDMQDYDEKRESVIKESRDTQKLSKQAIYCLHRGDFDAAAQKLTKAKTAADKLQPIVGAEPSLRSQGAYSASLEEWCEGMVFQTFLQERRILRLDEVPDLTRDEYLGGVLDFTGELNRYAVKCATERNIPAVQECRDVVDALMGIFLQFDFRNGNIRKKFDSLKYTLKKMETTLYEQSLTENLGFRRSEEPADDEPHSGIDGSNKDAAF